MRGAVTPLQLVEPRSLTDALRLMRDAAGDTDGPGRTPDHLPALPPGAAHGLCLHGKIFAQEAGL